MSEKCQFQTHAPQQIRPIRHLVAGRLSIGRAITGLSATAVSNHAGRPADVWSIAGSRSRAKPCSIGAIDSHRAADRHVLSDHELWFLLTRRVGHLATADGRAIPHVLKPSVRRCRLVASLSRRALSAALGQSCTWGALYPTATAMLEIGVNGILRSSASKSSRCHLENSRRASNPPPSRLASVSVPRSALASCWAMARPSPVPPVSRLREASTR